MSPPQQLKTTASFCIVCLAAVLLLNGCRHAYTHSVYFQVSMTSPSVSLTALKRGDLNAAARVLEPRLAANSKDAELSYTLGCVYLRQSEQVKDHQARLGLQTRGWQLVEAASGRYYGADALLAHAYLVGRWGKKRNSDLYGEHLRLSSEVYKKTPHKASKDEFSRVWLTLMPP
jgi:hypothetical protein